MMLFNKDFSKQVLAKRLRICMAILPSCLNPPLTLVHGFDLNTCALISRWLPPCLCQPPHLNSQHTIKQAAPQVSVSLLEEMCYKIKKKRKRGNTFKRVINHLNHTDTILHFGICLECCELFIKGSHGGNNFLNAFTPVLHLHLDRSMIPLQAFQSVRSSFS